MAEVGLLPFARIALQVAKAVLPRYRSRFSKHQFTQPQLLAILCLMRYEDWTFRAWREKWATRKLKVKGRAIRLQLRNCGGVEKATGRIGGRDAEPRFPRNGGFVGEHQVLHDAARGAARIDALLSVRTIDHKLAARHWRGRGHRDVDEVGGARRRIDHNVDVLKRGIVADEDQVIPCIPSRGLVCLKISLTLEIRGLGRQREFRRRSKGLRFERT